MVHAIGARGGMERVGLEVFTRLAKRGWKIDFYGFRLDDWPQAIPITWHKIPGNFVPIRLIKILWYQWIVPFYLKPSQAITLTSGTDAYRADVRLMHFLHHAFADLKDCNKVPLPNARTPLHYYYQALSLRINKYLERKYLLKAELLIAISTRVASDVKKYLGEDTSASVRVIHHAPDNASDPSASLPDEVMKKRRDGIPLILFVGALERKGIEKALKCLSRLKDLEWQFWVVGNGDIERWKKLSLTLGIADKTVFFGELSAGAFFGQSDVLLFPSIYEPFGLVITEAISQGCVPLASTECGAMELWADRESWLKLSAEDSEICWAAALRRLIVDAAMRKRLASQAALSLGGWSWDKVANAYEAALESLRVPSKFPQSRSKLAKMS